jgi:hypothetical protein
VTYTAEPGRVFRGPLGGEHWLQAASGDAQWRNATTAISAFQQFSG